MKRVLLVCVLGVSIAACDSKSSSPTSPSTSTPTPPISSSPTLRSVTLSVNEDAMKSKGHRAKQPRLVPSRMEPRRMSWRRAQTGSRTTLVLTINSGGLITAQGSGASTITTTCQVVSDHPVEVTFPVVASRLVTLTLGPGTSGMLGRGSHQ